MMAEPVAEQASACFNLESHLRAVADDLRAAQSANLDALAACWRAMVALDGYSRSPQSS